MHLNYKGFSNMIGVSYIFIPYEIGLFRYNLRIFLNLRGHNTQHSGHTYLNETTIEIQLVRPTEVCGKV